MEDGRWSLRVCPVTFQAMDLLSLRLAAGGGSIDHHESAALVAAGFTLLQRSPALVRALSGRRAGLVLPPSPQFLVALAAAEGRGAVLLDANASAHEVADAVRKMAIGALFAFSGAKTRLPASVVAVLLDEAPRSAAVLKPRGERHHVDLGSHFPIRIEGVTDVPGREEECLATADEHTGGWAKRSHREVLEAGRQSSPAPGPLDRLVIRGASWADYASLIETGIGPLLAGSRLRTESESARLAGDSSIRGY